MFPQVEHWGLLVKICIPMATSPFGNGMPPYTGDGVGGGAGGPELFVPAMPTPPYRTGHPPNPYPPPKPPVCPEGPALNGPPNPPPPPPPPPPPAQKVIP